MEQKCYICQSSNTSAESFTLQDDNRTLNILICQDCGHASRIDQPDFAKNLKNQENRFAEITQKPRSNLSWHKREVLVAHQLERMASAKGKILDIGCSSGQWLGLLSEKWEKYGVDISSVAANIARQYTKANIFCGPIEKYEVDIESFDVITAFAVIEHLHDPRKVVQWVYAHLKPGGIFLVLTPDRESKVAKRLGHKWRMYTPLVHMHFFSSQSLSRLVTEAGFIIKRREWRCLIDSPKSLLSLIGSCIGKTKEILRLTGKPYYDLFYLYAQKPL